MGELPLPVVGPSMAEVETRRSDGQCASPVVAVRHVVGAVCAGWRSFFEEVVDLVWLTRGDPNLFVLGSGPGGRDVVPPDWPYMAVRDDFSAGGDRRRIPLRNMCVHGGCSVCRCLTYNC